MKRSYRNSEGDSTRMKKGKQSSTRGPNGKNRKQPKVTVEEKEKNCKSESDARVQVVEKGKTKKNLFNTGRWDAIEHTMFLTGITKYDRDWKRVQQGIGTRSTTQVRSHAQKYFAKQNREHNTGLNEIQKVESALHKDSSNSKDKSSDIAKYFLHFMASNEPERKLNIQSLNAGKTIIRFEQGGKIKVIEPSPILEIVEELPRITEDFLRIENLNYPLFYSNGFGEYYNDDYVYLNAIGSSRATFQVLDSKYNPEFKNEVASYTNSLISAN